MASNNANRAAVAAAEAARKLNAAPAATSKAPASRDAAPVKTGRTVIVACKLPNGLILQLQRQQVFQEPTMNGMRDETRWVKYGERYIVPGPAYPVMPPKGYPRQVAVEGGFALTPDRGPGKSKVPAEFWEQWLEQNKNAPFVESGAIFAMSDIDDVVARCEEHADLKTGLEPLEVTSEKITDYRLPKPTMPDVYYSEAEAKAAGASAA